MILYLDTSSLVKLFLSEVGSNWVRARFQEAEIVTTSRVAYAEAMAAFARRYREGDFAADQLQAYVTGLNELWPNISALEIDERAAGQLAIKHGMRGFDAIHVAAAAKLRQAMPHVDLLFLSFDGRQNSAARAEGLLLPATD